MTRIRTVSAARRLSSLGIPLCACAIAGSCASGTLFRDDFGGHQVGQPPSLNPPGPPPGDEINISGIGIQPEHMPIVISDAALGSKALRYAETDSPLGNPYVAFVSAASSLPANQTFRAVWTGRIDLDPDGSGLDVWLGDTHFEVIAAIRFKNGNVLLRTSGGAEPSYELLGPYQEGANHTVFITVDKGPGQYSAVVMPFNVTSGWRPVLSTSAMSPSRPTLYMHFSEESRSSSGYYAIDEVHISKVK